MFTAVFYRIRFAGTIVIVRAWFAGALAIFAVLFFGARRIVCAVGICATKQRVGVWNHAKLHFLVVAFDLCCIALLTALPKCADFRFVATIVNRPTVVGIITIATIAARVWMLSDCTLNRAFAADTYISTIARFTSIVWAIGVGFGACTSSTTIIFTILWIDAAITA